MLKYLFNKNKLFNEGNTPLLKLTFNNKISYMFGSCHSVSLDKLLLNPFSMSDDSKYLINFINNKKTLITECGYYNQNKIYKLDSPASLKNEIIKTYQKKEILDQYDNLINEYDFYHRLIKIFKWQKNDDNKSIKYFNIINYMKRDSLYKVFDKIGEDPSNISNLELAKILYRTAITNGIDINLIYNYMKNGRYIYSLDNPTGIEENDELLRLLDKRFKRAILVLFLMSKILKDDIVRLYQKELHELEHDYLYNEWDINKRVKDYIMLDKRNERWIPWIIRYHNETEDPLFIVGCGHLNGNYGLIELLKNNNFEVGLFNLKSRQFKDL